MKKQLGVRCTLSFNHQIWQEAICHFHTISMLMIIHMARTLHVFAAKHIKTVLSMSRPLFVSSYLQVMCWTLGQWKARKNTSYDNKKWLPRLVNERFSSLHEHARESQKTDKKNPQSSNKNPQQIQITTLVHRDLLNKTESRIQI